MGKRGFALILSLMAVTVLGVLLSSFFYMSVNENNFVKRYVNTTRAFWLAEAGIAQAIRNMPNNVSGSLGGDNYTFSAATSLVSGQYYNITSTGSVLMPSGGQVQRTLQSVVKTSSVYPGRFQHAIRTTVELERRGAAQIIGPVEEHAALDFPDLFDASKEEFKQLANNAYINPPNNVTPVNGITWVDMSPGSEFKIATSGWQGSGILVVNGNAQITGGTFDGIIYVIGELRMSGNAQIHGTVLVESNAQVIEDTTVTGTVDIIYDLAAITAALDPLRFLSPEPVSWREA